MQKWKCISSGDGTWDFEKGKVYSEDKGGYLRDSEGNLRLKAYRYNEKQAPYIPKFKKHVENLENK